MQYIEKLGKKAISAGASLIVLGSVMSMVKDKTPYFFGRFNK